MGLGSGALLFSLAVGIIGGLSIVRRQVLAPWFMSFGVAICLYWVTAIQFDLWIPPILLPGWYQLGLLGFLLIAGGAFGVMVKLLARRAT